MRRIHFIPLVTLTLSTLILAYGLSPQTTSRRGQAATGQSQLAKAKKVLVKELPEGMEGIALENGRFKLMPGYKFVPQPNGTVTVALQAGGRPVSGSYDCSCSGGSGTCSVLADSTGISCFKDKKDTCSKECKMTGTIRGSKTVLAIF